MVPADPFADFKTVYIREHHIQDRQIQLFSVNAVQRLLRGIAFENRESLVFQIERNQIGDLPLIIYDKDFFGRNDPSFCSVSYILHHPEMGVYNNIPKNFLRDL